MEVARCAYLAVVTEGLEFIAEKELKSKLQHEIGDQIHYESGTGLMYFSVPSTVMIHTNQFDTVESLFIIIEQGRKEGLSEYNKEEAIEFFGNLVFDIQEDKWRAGVRKWSEIFCLPLPSMTQLNAKFDPHPSPGASPTPSDEDFLVPFRCSCKRSGVHKWDSVLAAAAVGGGIIQRYGWPVSLKSYRLEIYVQLDGEGYLIGISLGAKPKDENCSTSSSHKMGKSKRRRMKGEVQELGRTSLSPLVANSIRLYADLQGGEVVIDPFCGVGTLPIHFASFYPNILAIGADLDEECAEKAGANVLKWKSKKYEEGTATSNVEIIRWNAWSIPLRPSTVDIVVSDLPFGIRSGSKRGIHLLYPRALKEMARVTQINGKGYLITAQKEHMTAILENNFSRVWRVDAIIPFKMCNLSVNLYHITRIGKEDFSGEINIDTEQTKRKSQQPKSDSHRKKKAK